MSAIIFVAGLLSARALAANIVFANGANCTSTPLYGTTGLPSAPCYNISTFPLASSVLLSNVTEGQTIKFFSDEECSAEMFSTTSDACYTPDSRISSWLVEAESPAGNVETRDVAPYAVKLSDYSQSGLTTPYDVDIAYSNLIIGVTAIAVSGGVTIYNSYESCRNLATDQSISSIFACIGEPISVICAYLASHYLAKAGQNANTALNQGDGTFTNVRRRELIDAVNFEYMSSAMNSTGTEHSGVTPVHVGNMVRSVNGIEHTSPLHEIDMGAVGKWHFTAHYDDQYGSFVHHMHAAPSIINEDTLQERSSPYGYNTIRWNSGGLDARFCPYNPSQPSSGYSGQSVQDIYNTIYDQLTCDMTQSQLKAAQGIMMDLYNEASTIKGEVDLRPYSGSKTVTPPACSTNYAPLNQDCFVD